MASQFIELLIFAGVAFFIINKLIATLGTTSEDDQVKHRSVFGESNSLKDVTNSADNSARQSTEKTFSYPHNLNPDILEEFIVAENPENIGRSYAILSKRLPDFNLIKFLNSAKMAFKMIIELSSSEPEKLKTLIDKRYLEQFKTFVARYNIPVQEDNLSAKVADIYMFGNNVFIKVLFTGKNVILNITELKEEWTFSKSLIKPGPEWYLSNIE